MIQTKELTEENKEYLLNINKEQPYINIVSLETFNEDKKIESLDVSIHYTILYTTGTTQGMLDATDFGILGNNPKSGFNMVNAESVQLKFENHNKEELTSLRIEIKYETLKELDIKKPQREFNEHISYAGNNKIIFSAPFGHGKSTFLDLFFEAKKEEYNVFKVYPINYSVATNQDIFRYIKTDLLFQLLEYDLYFEQKNETFLNTIDTLITEKVINVKNTLVTLSKLYFTLDKTNAHFGKGIELLDSILSKISNKQKELSKNEKKDVLEYLEVAYEKEGSIYEDNLYTQLIRAFLNQIKVNSPKKNILIIEDLDRMDPEHVFRILNIISAHFDTYRQSEFENSNKFGFDKIIVVGDLNNLEHLFAHKFGKEVDFSGYINKFFSVSPFYYDNKKAFSSEIDDFFDTSGRLHNDWYSAINYIFEILINGNQLSLRDLMRIKHYNFNEIISETRNYRTHYTLLPNGLFIPIIGLLSKIFSKNQLITKFEICKIKRINKNQGVYDRTLNKNCLALLGALGKKSGNNFKYELDNTKFDFNTDTGDNIYETTITKGSIIHSGNTSLDILEHKFTLDNFYQLLIETVISYYQLVETSKK